MDGLVVPALLAYVSSNQSSILIQRPMRGLLLTRRRGHMMRLGGRIQQSEGLWELAFLHWHFPNLE